MAGALRASRKKAKKIEQNVVKKTTELPEAEKKVADTKKKVAAAAKRKPAKKKEQFDK